MIIEAYFNRYVFRFDLKIVILWVHDAHFVFIVLHWNVLLCSGPLENKTLCLKGLFLLLN